VPTVISGHPTRERLGLVGDGRIHLIPLFICE